MQCRYAVKVCSLWFFHTDFDALLAGEVGGVEFGKLPFGACEDPIRFDFCVDILC